jgi:thioredoxin-dependent peroxiredoxin
MSAEFVVAPDFTLPNLEGVAKSLSDLRGRKVLISLLRNAQCAICNLWVHEAAKRAADWRSRGLEVLAVFESTTAKLRSQFEDRHPPFEILADADGKVHEAFGSVNDPERVQELMRTGESNDALERAHAAGFDPVMEQGANFFRIPSEILIDAEGRVVAVHHADAIANHMPTDTIENFVATP